LEDIGIASVKTVRGDPPVAVDSHCIGELYEAPRRVAPVQKRKAQKLATGVDKGTRHLEIPRGDGIRAAHDLARVIDPLSLTVAVWAVREVAQICHLPVQADERVLDLGSVRTGRAAATLSIIRIADDLAIVIDARLGAEVTPWQDSQIGPDAVSIQKGVRGKFVCCWSYTPHGGATGNIDTLRTDCPSVAAIPSEGAQVCYRAVFVPNSTITGDIVDVALPDDEACIADTVGADKHSVSVWIGARQQLQTAAGMPGDRKPIGAVLELR